MTTRKLTPLQRAVIAAAVAAPGSTIADLGRAVGAKPWSGGHQTRVRTLEAYGWLTIDRDYSAAYAPCRVYPTEAAVRLINEEAA